MNVLSLFDGISCGMLALQRANIPIDNYYASEICSDAIKISEHHHKNIIRLGDVTKWKEWDIDWKSIDLLIGGSPCQGFSSAGKRLNFNDPRSKLFFVYLDILNHIKSVNEDVKFLLENVKMNKTIESHISELLGCKPVMINSALVSAQNRVRYYWANFPITIPNDLGIKVSDIYESPGYPGAMRGRKLVNGKRNDKLNAKTIQYIECRKDNKTNCVTTVSKDNVVVDEIVSRIEAHTNRHKWRYLTPLEQERLQTLPDNYTDCSLSKNRRTKAIGNGWTVDVIVHIFRGMSTYI